MISQAGIAVFIFGNKKDDIGNIINASGVKREFEISLQHGLIPIPVGVTGYMTKEILTIILNNPITYFADKDWIVPLIKDLNSDGISEDDIISKILYIIQKVSFLKRNWQ